MTDFKIATYGLAVLLAAALGLAAQAAEEPSELSLGTPAPGAAPSANLSSADPGPPSIQSSLGPYGDPGGIRDGFASIGVRSGLTYIGETFTTMKGGIRRGTTYQGLLAGYIDVDAEKLLGWKGATFLVNVFQMHGRGQSRENVGNLITISDIEALPATRLDEIWFEQRLLDDRLSLRAGQLAIDTEFLISDHAALFINGSLGWPAIYNANLPSGGPDYPFATPALRARFDPSERLSLAVALFNGDPAGPARPGSDPDPQRRNRTGTNFRVTDPPLLIAEASYSYNGEKDASGLPGTVKFGAWHHFGRFEDQRFTAERLSLADPGGSGVARRLRGNDGIYGVVDQVLYRVPDTRDQGLAAFARVAASPDDRNLLGFYADSGLAYKGPLPGRPNDSVGVSVAYVRVSDRVRALDRDAIFFTGAPASIRSAEAVLEATYQAQIVPGWLVQPDFQYVFHPGANASNPRNPSTGRIRDAAVFGVRTVIRY